MNNLTPGHILVVDDQDNWRKAITSLLTAEGHIVKTAGSFEDAEVEISHGTFDLVILDLRLVDEDMFNVQGLELLQLAKAKTGATPRAILLTAYPGSLRKGVPEKLGADKVLFKVPQGSKFDIKSFKETVRNLVAR